MDIVEQNLSFIHDQEKKNPFIILSASKLDMHCMVYTGQH